MMGRPLPALPAFFALPALPAFFALLASLLPLGGCPSAGPEPASEEPTPFPDYCDDDDATLGDDDDLIGGPYPAVLEPDFDQAQVSRLAPPFVEFSEEGIEATLRLTTPDGSLVPGRSVRVGSVRTLFLADAPLRPETTYGMAVSWGDDELGWSFTTRAARPPVGSLDGVTLAWDVTAGDASSPPGGEAFVGALPLELLTGLGAGAEGVSVLGALASQDVSPLEQDPCLATFSPTVTEPATWEDPLLATPGSLIPLSVDLSIVGFGTRLLPLRDARFWAELEAGEGGLALAEGSFFAWVDAREVSVAGVCETLASVAIPCVPCPGDGAEQCVYLSLDQIPGGQVALTLSELDGSDVAANPECAGEG